MGMDAGMDCDATSKTTLGPILDQIQSLQSRQQELLGTLGSMKTQVVGASPSAGVDKAIEEPNALIDKLHYAVVQAHDNHSLISTLVAEISSVVTG